jgi:hypothetical protein
MVTLDSLVATTAAYQRATKNADAFRHERDDMICALHLAGESLRTIASAASLTHGGVNDVLRRRGCKEVGK